MTDLNKIKQYLTNGQLVGLTIYGEARNQSIDGRVAVGCVIRNRLFSGENFGGTTYKDLCLAPRQFSCWHEKGSNFDELVKAVDSVIAGTTYNNLTLKECLYIGQGIVDNCFRDNIKGACYYRTINLMKEKPIQTVWSIEIDDHVFYRPV